MTRRLITVNEMEYQEKGHKSEWKKKSELRVMQEHFFSLISHEVMHVDQYLFDSVHECTNLLLLQGLGVDPWIILPS